SASPPSPRAPRCPSPVSRCAHKKAYAIRSPRSSFCKPTLTSAMPMDEPLAGLPTAEEAFAALVEKLRGAVAADAKLIGIYSGGAWLAERIAALLPVANPVGFIDVSFYRDDYGQKGLRAKVRSTKLPFEVPGSRIVLVDDVLYTGRSVRVSRSRAS